MWSHSASIMACRLDEACPLDFGLIAEEVAQVYPDLVTRNDAGEIQTVRYDQLVPLLLNEVQAQHRELDAERKNHRTQENRLRAQEQRITELLRLQERVAQLEAQHAD